MNCKTFHGVLYDYLDETLDAKAQAEAQQHLQLCDACLRAFLREQALAKFMGESLSRATAGLSIHPEIRQNVLEALELDPAPATAWMQAWQHFISNPLRRIGAMAVLPGVFLLFLGIHYYRRMAKEPASQALPQTGGYTWVVDVPILTQTHVFRRQNNTVMDSIAVDRGVAHADLFEDHDRPSPKPSSKPL